MVISTVSHPSQVCFHLLHALHQYCRAHLALHVNRLQQRLAGRWPPTEPPAHKAVDVGPEAHDSLLAALDSDRRLAEAFVR